MRVVETENGATTGRVFEVDGTGRLLSATIPERPGWRPSIRKVLADTFLPAGYPHSVRPEYLEYQAWDALQGLSSYLRSVLTTRSLLAGIGVGSATATPLSAALTWVLRDGFGMVGGLVIAYACSGSFEVYTKEWRLFADFLNNFGLTMDLLSSVNDSKYFIPIILLSTLSKAGCGLIAGATKTRISSHFARAGHLADVSAKESTQETAVALVGLVLGMGLAQCTGDDSPLITWTSFVVLLVLHQYANYRLVKVLVFHSLNPQRARIIASRLIGSAPESASAFCSASASAMVAAHISPEAVAAAETLWQPIWLCWHGPRLGASFGEVCVRGLLAPLEAWQGLPCVIGRSVSGRLSVALREGAADEDVVQAFFVACRLEAVAAPAEKHPVPAARTSCEAEVRAAHAWWLQCRARLVQEGWCLSDCSALGPGSMRFSCMEESKKTS